MEIKDLTTELERDLYVEIVGAKRGLESYLKWADGKGFEDIEVYKYAKIKLEVFTELAKIIEDEK